jgi:hypothetical protein
MTAGQASNRSVSRRQQQQDPDEQVVQRLLDPLVKALAEPGEASRNAAVAGVCRSYADARAGPVIDALVELLGREEGPVRGQSLAYLSRFGPQVLPTLVLTFTRTSSAPLQRGIIEALTRIAGTLDRARQVELVTDLVVLARFAVEPAVRLELGKVLIVVRRSNDATEGTS